VTYGDITDPPMCADEPMRRTIERVGAALPELDEAGELLGQAQRSADRMRTGPARRSVIVWLAGCARRWLAGDDGVVRFTDGEIARLAAHLEVD
jgi:hypothetical protein